MKKVVALLLTAVFAISLLMTGCANGSSGSSGKSNKVLKVGILQYVQHPALDAVTENAKKALNDAGFVENKNITYDFQNAQGEVANCKTIAQKFVSEKVDLILAVATPAAQAVVSETTDIPVVFSAVTDPVKADLVKDVKAPDKNVTGVSDYVKVEPLMKQIEKLYPNFKSIGAIYNKGEINSVSSIDELKAWASTNGKEVVDGTVANTSEIQQVVSSVAPKVDILFSPTDNAIASAMPTAIQTAIDSKKPYFVSEEGMVKNGGLMAVGMNYTIVGQATGEIMVQILNGKKPSEIPVKYLDILDLYLNQKTADSLGLTIPADMLSSAKEVIK
ncbi:MAG: ABC transporter substrate-binding protein [Bacillota bacterium]|nr:ABC transporter substrate-binding protein [Bacillota bacterium]